MWPHARRHAILVEFVRPFRHDGHIQRAPTFVLSIDAPFNMVGADEDEDDDDELLLDDDDEDDAARLAGDDAGVGPRLRSLLDDDDEDDELAAAAGLLATRCSGWDVSPAMVSTAGRNCFNLLQYIHYYNPIIAIQVITECMYRSVCWPSGQHVVDVGADNIFFGPASGVNYMMMYIMSYVMRTKAWPCDVYVIH